MSAKRKYNAVHEKDVSQRFHSQLVPYSHSGNGRRKAFENLRAVAEDLFENHFRDIDHLKKPTTMRVPGSAKLSRQSFNIYFGADVIGTQHDDGTVERFAYATGTGASTIGIDASTLQINPLPEWFAELKDLIFESLVGDLARYKQQDYNGASVKIYYENPRLKGNEPNKTPWHCDVLYKKENGMPKKGNSQEPFSNVLIATFGGDKVLKFSRGAKKGMFQQKKTFEMRQCDTKFFVLDYRDEMFGNDGQKWWHASMMAKHNQGRVVISIMLRKIQSKVRVRMDDSRLAVIPCINSQEEVYWVSLRSKYKEDEEYKRHVHVIHQKFIETLQRRNPYN